MATSSKTAALAPPMIAKIVNESKYAVAVGVARVTEAWVVAENVSFFLKTISKKLETRAILFKARNLKQMNIEINM